MSTIFPEDLTQRMSWRTFTAAPHRMMFFGGAVQLIGVIAFWAIELIGRYTGLWSPLQTTIAPTWAHAFLMLYTLFPFFMFGFLMTTYPRWMRGELVPQQAYVRTFLLLAAGVGLFYLGLFSSARLAAVGIMLLLAGWAVGLLALYRVFARAPATDKSYERALNAALLAGWLGALSYLVWLLSDQWPFLNLALRTGLWLFLIPVLFVVSHRMIPFFSVNALQDYRVIQPKWSLPVLGVGVLGHFILETAGLLQWVFLFDVPLFLLGLHHSLSWSLRRSFEVRLLAVLHLAFLWFAIGTALYSVQSLALLVSGDFVLGKAPLHALGIGFIAAMVIAMATRVTLGHSGRALVADTFTWICFLVLNGAAVLRVAADLPVLNTLPGVHLNVLAALVWLACLLPWTLRYGAMYLQPRVDGKPG